MSQQDSARHRHQEIIKSANALEASDEAMVAEEIAEQVGVSPRTLRHIWAKHYGISPGRYWRQRRMERARLALIKGNTRVTDVAMEFGFFELGRFAVRYRERYGETPSTTLRSQ